MATIDSPRVVQSARAANARDRCCAALRCAAVARLPSKISWRTFAVGALAGVLCAGLLSLLFRLAVALACGAFVLIAVFVLYGSIDRLAVLRRRR
jgi:hypothetical protein